MHWTKKSALMNVSTRAESLRAVCVNNAPYLEGKKRNVEEIDRASKLQEAVHAAANLKIRPSRIFEAISTPIIVGEK